MADKKLVIWVPLRPFSKWQGEGIAHTLERIVSVIQDDIKCEIVCLSYHKKDIMNSIGKLNNVSFKTILSGSEDIESLFEDRSVYVKKSFIKLLNILYRYFCFSWYIVCCAYLALTVRFSRKVKMIWCPTFAVLFSSFNFKCKKIVNFWDGFVFEYAGFEGVQRPVYKRMLSYLNSATVIITQSDHNLEFLTSVVGIAEDKITLIQNPNPNCEGVLSVEELNAIQKDRKNAFNIFKNYNNKKKLKVFLRNAVFKRLIDESEENTKIIFISTQNRPYKGFPQLFYALDVMKKMYPDVSISILTTAANVTDLIEDNVYRYNWVYTRVYNIKRVDKKLHAIMYAISDLVLHPSFAEGGHGVYPLFEAACFGKATLMNKGRHTDMLLKTFPELAKLCVDFTDARKLAKNIKLLLDDNNATKGFADIVKSRIENKEQSTDKYKDLFISMI